VIAVTGGNSGLGYETIRYLVQDGALIIMAVRDVAKGKAAFDQLYHEGEVDSTKAQKPQVIVMELDLGSLNSVRAFAKAFKAQFPKLDVLINNAGLCFDEWFARFIFLFGHVNRHYGSARAHCDCRRFRSTLFFFSHSRAYRISDYSIYIRCVLQAQMGTNHLGHFLLTSLLMPVMAPNGRIVNHASTAYQFAASNNFVTEDLFSEKSYSAWSAYGNSKAANLMFTFELNRRLNASTNSRHLSAYAVHPGYSATNLQNGRFPGWEWANQNLAMSAELGCLSQVYGTPTLISLFFFFSHFYSLQMLQLLSALMRAPVISRLSVRSIKCLVRRPRLPLQRSPPTLTRCARCGRSAPSRRAPSGRSEYDTQTCIFMLKIAACMQNLSIFYVQNNEKKSVQVAALHWYCCKLFSAAQGCTGAPDGDDAGCAGVIPAAAGCV
jgi:NAD(P)-dependent dehydrogenase (short-subunit alcohol dehydrogenase family)